MKRITALFLSLLLTLSLIPTAFASTNGAGGTLGETLSWNIDSDGYLSVTGTVPTGAKVCAATYNVKRQLVNARFVDVSDGAVPLDVNASTCKLFLVDENGAPLCASAQSVYRAGYDMEAWRKYYVESVAAYYGVEDLIRDYNPSVSPSRPEDVEAAVVYAYLTGNYSLNFVYDTKEEAKEARDLLWPPEMKWLWNRYASFMGFYSNISGSWRVQEREDGKFVFFIDVETPALTEDELFEQQQTALNTALALKDALYAEGTLNNAMTQREKVIAYYNYFVSLNVQPSGIGGNSDNRGQYMCYDSAYACLVNKKADCVGRAAAFDLMMHLEGIPSFCAAGEIAGTQSGHVLNAVYVEGKDYICDFGNHYPLQTVEEARHWFVFEDDFFSAQWRHDYAMEVDAYYGVEDLLENYNPNSSPMTAEEVEAAVVYAYLSGNYSLNFEYDTLDKAEAAFDLMKPQKIQKIWTKYASFMGFYRNINGWWDITREGENKYVFRIIAEDPALNENSLFGQQQIALEKAIALKNKLYEDGKLTSEMSQEAKVNAYYDYFVNLNVQPRELGIDFNKSGESMRYDSAYACLVNNKASSIGRAAAFDLLMRLEDIPSFCTAGKMNGAKQSHVVNCVQLGEQVYVCDFGSQKSLQTIEAAREWFTFDDNTLG